MISSDYRFYDTIYRYIINVYVFVYLTIAF